MEEVTLQIIEYPKPWVLFWVAVLLGHCYMDYAFYRKWRSWGRGTRKRKDHHGRRMRAAKIWVSEVFLQRQIFGLSSFRWLIHFLIFWGFIALTTLSLSLFIVRPLGFFGLDGGLARFFFEGKGHLLIKVWGDGFGLILFLGLAASSVRRFLLRPAQQSEDRTDRFLLIYLLWMTLSGFALEGLRLALVPAEVARYSFIGRLFIPPGSWTPAALSPWLKAFWSLHAFTGVALLFYLPHSRLMHSILAPLIIALNAVEEQERKDIYWPETAKHRPTRSPGA